MSSPLPPDVQQFVSEQLASGRYRSADEVVVDGLRALQDLKRLQEEFRHEVQLGVEQLDRGEGRSIERDQLRAFFDQLQARGRARYEASRREP